jgi:hypothetical protein
VRCGAVLDATLEYHDATIGVTWDVLETHADTLFPMDPETEKLVGKFNEEYGIAPDLTWKNVETTWKRFLKEQKTAAANAGAAKEDN